ncbi:MAG: MauE/DoxX family redox-associated membrane protein [Acidobacteriota bacterium]
MFDTFLLVARLLLAAVFTVAGVAKLSDPSGSRKSVGEFGVPAFLTTAFALLLPLAELACAAGLVSAGWAWLGASGALGLLVLFVAAISVSMIRGRRPNCRCFGQLHSSPVGWPTLFRNFALAGVAALVLWRSQAYADTAYMESGFGRTFDAFSRAGTAAIVLALVVVAQGIVGAFTLYHVLRQNGRTLERLDAIEVKLGVVPTAEQPQVAGLPARSAAPRFSLTGLDGETVTLQALSESGKGVLLFFSEPGCGACDAILPDVGRWQREHAERLVVVPISQGKADVNRAKGRTHKVQNILLQLNREVAESYRAEITPSAVLVIDGAIARPLAVGAEAIRALVKDATGPPTLMKGERVPFLPVRDLNGGTFDLATILGHRTLLLFWNPSCGFCAGMLDKVKVWETNRPEDAPELVVISAGSPKANREQGFRSRVLLDSAFSVGARFGAGGTPSAVILDEAGRVASDVGVGAEAVLALAAATTPVAVF